MTKKLKNKLITWVVIFAILALLVTLKVIVDNQEMQKSKPNIIDIDGIAHLEKNGYVCKLLDSDGRQIVYNEELELKHEFNVSHISSESGSNDKYIFEDTYTNMIYILISSDTNNIPLLNVMYNSSWVVDEDKETIEYNTITFITN